MKDNTYLAGTILVAALIIAVAIIYSFGPSRPPTTLNGNDSNVSLPSFETRLPFKQTPSPEGEIILGDLNAPVEIVEYGDYQCPFCARFFLESEEKIRANYIGPGKAKMIYKDLAFLGPESLDAALAANCAADEGKFWEYHDALFTVESKDNKEHNGNLNKELFMAIADKLELDKGTFESCYDSRKYDGEVQTDIAEAQQDLARVSTPSILINGELVQGAQPYDTFAAVIDKYIK
jgi:protein-disulfide isomerase